MANKDATEARVKNVMKDLPPQVYRPIPKMRNTLKQSFSGMKTILNQIAEKGQMKKAYQQQKKKAESKKKNYVAVIAIIVILIVLVATAIVLLT